MCSSPLMLTAPAKVFPQQPSKPQPAHSKHTASTQSPPSGVYSLLIYEPVIVARATLIGHVTYLGITLNGKKASCKSLNSRSNVIFRIKLILNFFPNLKSVYKTYPKTQTRIQCKNQCETQCNTCGKTGIFLLINT